jgi:porin
MSIDQFDNQSYGARHAFWDSGPKLRRNSSFRRACCMALGVLWGASLLDSAAAAQPEDTKEKSATQTKVHSKRKKSGRVTTGDLAKTKSDAKSAAASATSPQEAAASTAKWLAQLDKTLGYKGWDIAFPSYADTVTQDIGGFRSDLANYGFGFIALHGPVAAGNMLNSLSSGPGPSNGPGKGYSTQQYWGQVPSAIYGSWLYLVYDTSRYGIPDGQIAISGSAVASTWNDFLPNRVGLNDLSWYQTLFGGKVELKIGYIHNGQEFVGASIGGTFASPFGASASIPYLMGMAPNASTQPTARVTWHITDSIYDEFAVMRSLPIDGLTGNDIYDDAILNPTGFRFAVPNGGVLTVNEFGWKNEAAPGAPKTWIRAGAMYNGSQFANYSTGRADSGVTAGYFPADRQIWQVASGSPLTAYRGLYAGVSAMYAPPEYAAFSQYYEARLYSIGLFDARPEDLIVLSYNHNTFSRNLVSSINLASLQTGIFAHQGGSNSATFAYTAHLSPGIYLTGGLSYTDNPSLTYVRNQGSGLSWLACLSLIF